MNDSLYLVVAGLLLVTTARADGPQLQYGPPVSPLFFKDLEPTKPSSTVEFSPRREFLGVSKQPASVKMVELLDEHPYGENGRRTVWLARYELVRVQAPDTSRSAAVALSLAFDTATSDLLCAFTDPAPRWARSTLPPLDPEAHTAEEGWKSSPAHYEELRSTLTEVLAVLWKRSGVDPSKTGQIVIRPRFVANPNFVNTVDRSPLYPPANVWIVEVLGTVVMRRHFLGQEHLLTTLVAHVRDGDLKVLPGSMF